MACRYRKWSESVSKAPATVAVIYCAEYGYADRLSQTIARPASILSTLASGLCPHTACNAPSRTAPVHNSQCFHLHDQC